MIHLKQMKLQTVGLACVLAASLFSSTAVWADTVRVKIAGTLPTEHFAHEVLEKMAENIENAGVDLKVKYFPASQLGSGEELLEDAIRGNIDMVHATVYAQKDPRLEINSLPFMVGSSEELRKVYGDPNSEYNKVLKEILTSFGIVPLATIGEGLIGMVASKKPADLKGFGNQNMNVRVWSSKITKQTMEELGFQTTTMNWAEVFPALQAGTIDGAICCTAEWAYSTFAVSDVGKYFIPYNAFIESTMIYGNQKFMDKLSAEQKSVVEKYTAEAAAEIVDKAWERNQGFIDKLKEKGWEILEFSDEEMTAIKARIREKVWPQVGEVVGDDLLKRISE